MKIGTLARAVGFTASAIRYYEDVAVITRPGRAGGVRDYGDDAVEESRLLRYYRATGLTIRQLAAFARHMRGSQARREAWSGVIRARIAELDAQISQAQRMKASLEEAIGCTCLDSGTECVIDRATSEMAP